MTLTATATAATAYRERKDEGLTDELVYVVQRHASEHYSDGGWDVVVECWTEEEIIEAIGWAETLRGAIAKVAHVVGIFADRQADAVNSAF